jgi:hypothetical protein
VVRGKGRETCRVREKWTLKHSILIFSISVMRTQWISKDCRQNLGCNWWARNESGCNLLIIVLISEEEVPCKGFPCSFLFPMEAMWLLLQSTWKVRLHKQQTFLQVLFGHMSHSLCFKEHPHLSWKECMNGRSPSTRAT